MACYLELIDLSSSPHSRRKLKVEFDKELVKNQISSYKCTPLDAYSAKPFKKSDQIIVLLEGFSKLIRIHT